MVLPLRKSARRFFQVRKIGKNSTSNKKSNLYTLHTFNSKLRLSQEMKKKNCVSRYILQITLHRKYKSKISFRLIFIYVTKKVIYLRREKKIQPSDEPSQHPTRLWLLWYVMVHIQVYRSGYGCLGRIRISKNLGSGFENSITWEKKSKVNSNMSKPDMG